MVFLSVPPQADQVGHIIIVPTASRPMNWPAVQDIALNAANVKGSGVVVASQYRLAYWLANTPQVGFI